MKRKNPHHHHINVKQIKKTEQLIMKKKHTHKIMKNTPKNIPSQNERKTHQPKMNQNNTPTQDERKQNTSSRY